MANVISFPQAPLGAELEIIYSPGLGEVAIGGTSGGLAKLADSIMALAHHPEAGVGSHVHIGGNEGGLRPGSLELTVGIIAENPPGEDGLVLVPREDRPFAPQDVFVVQFGFDLDGPEETYITAGRLYPVLLAESGADMDNLISVFPGQEDRYCTLTIIDDTGRSYAFGVHYDDPDVNFFSQEEISRLIIRPA